jgi:hypothetical protein
MWVPLMLLFYVGIPLFVWDFSPDVLTRSMPYFLVGGSDWGGGNVFAFTKLIYWISIIGGAVANCRISVAVHAATFVGMCGFIFRNFVWHALAAIALVLGWKIPDHTRVGDLWSLTAYLFGAMFVIVWMSSALEKRQLHHWRMVICIAIALLWGFVPIGRG